MIRLDTKEKRLAWRFVPENATVIDDGHCIAYEYEDKRGRLAAVGYRGTSSKPDFHYVYPTQERRRKAIDEWRNRVADHIAYVNERKQARKTFANPFKVGDILDSLWGYDQTNVDYYQVIAVTAKTVTLQKIRQNSEEDGFMQGHCTPRPNDFVKDSKPSTHKVSSNYINLTSYSGASLWDGKPMHWTAYA
jgi:hypothetical protein